MFVNARFSGSKGNESDYVAGSPYKAYYTRDYQVVIINGSNAPRDVEVSLLETRRLRILLQMLFRRHT
jgi:hypothetical protein